MSGEVLFVAFCAQPALLAITNKSVAEWMLIVKRVVWFTFDLARYPLVAHMYMYKTYVYITTHITVRICVIYLQSATYILTTVRVAYV